MLPIDLNTSAICRMRCRGFYPRNGSIITFHDSLKSIEKLKTALPQAIEWLMEQGYEFKTFE